MTGGGFGGCTVSLVEQSALDDFIQTVGQAYKEKVGYAADFYTVKPAAGARILNEPA